MDVTMYNIPEGFTLIKQHCPTRLPNPLQGSYAGSMSPYVHHEPRFPYVRAGVGSYTGSIPDYGHHELQMSFGGSLAGSISPANYHEPRLPYAQAGVGSYTGSISRRGHHELQRSATDEPTDLTGVLLRKRKYKEGQYFEDPNKNEMEIGNSKIMESDEASVIFKLSAKAGLPVNSREQLSDEFSKIMGNMLLDVNYDDETQCTAWLRFRSSEMSADDIAKKFLESSIENSHLQDLDKIEVLDSHGNVVATRDTGSAVKRFFDGRGRSPGSNLRVRFIGCSSSNLWIPSPENMESKYIRRTEELWKTMFGVYLNVKDGGVTPLRDGVQFKTPAPSQNDYFNLVTKCMDSSIAKLLLMHAFKKIEISFAVNDETVVFTRDFHVRKTITRSKLLECLPFTRDELNAFDALNSAFPRTSKNGIVLRRKDTPKEFVLFTYICRIPVAKDTVSRCKEWLRKKLSSFLNLKAELDPNKFTETFGEREDKLSRSVLLGVNLPKAAVDELHQRSQEWEKSGYAPRITFADRAKNEIASPGSSSGYGYTHPSGPLPPPPPPPRAPALRIVKSSDSFNQKVKMFENPDRTYPGAVCHHAARPTTGIPIKAAPMVKVVYY